MTIAETRSNLTSLAVLVDHAQTPLSPAQCSPEQCDTHDLKTHITSYPQSQTSLDTVDDSSFHSALFRPAKAWCSLSSMSVTTEECTDAITFARPIRQLRPPSNQSLPAACSRPLLRTALPAQRQSYSWFSDVTDTNQSLEEWIRRMQELPSTSRSDVDNATPLIGESKVELNMGSDIIMAAPDSASSEFLLADVTDRSNRSAEGGKPRRTWWRCISMPISEGVAGRGIKRVRRNIQKRRWQSELKKYDLGAAMLGPELNRSPGIPPYGTTEHLIECGVRDRDCETDGWVGFKVDLMGDGCYKEDGTTQLQPTNKGKDRLGDLINLVCTELRTSITAPSKKVKKRVCRPDNAPIATSSLSFRTGAVKD